MINVFPQLSSTDGNSVDCILLPFFSQMKTISITLHFHTFTTFKTENNFCLFVYSPPLIPNAFEQQNMPAPTFCIAHSVLQTSWILSIISRHSICCLLMLNHSNIYSITLLLFILNQNNNSCKHIIPVIQARYSLIHLQKPQVPNLAQNLRIP